MRDINLAEQSVLGCLILHPEMIPDTSVRLKPTDFSTGFHERVFSALCAMHKQGKSIDIATVDDEIHAERNETVDLIEFTQQACIPSMLAAHIDIVANHATRSNLARIAQRMLEMAKDEERDTSEIVSMTQEALTKANTSPIAYTSHMDTLTAAYNSIEEQSLGKIVPCVSDLEKLDYLTGGFFPGELTIIGARPSVGKTALGTFITTANALKGKRVALVSAEMNAEQLGKRELAGAADINGMKFRHAESITSEEWDKLGDAFVAYSTLPIEHLYTREIEDVVSATRRLHDRVGCDLLVVDYIQLMQTRRRFDADWQRIGYITKELKALATTLNIPVIALAQLSREGVKTDGVPGMEALRGSGDMEQDADNVMILHRFDETPKDQQLVEVWKTVTNKGDKFLALNVCKQRQGEIGTVYVGLKSSRSMFYTVRI